MPALSRVDHCLGRAAGHSRPRWHARGARTRGVFEARAPRPEDNPREARGDEEVTVTKRRGKPGKKSAKVKRKRMAIADLNEASYNPRVISDAALAGLSASLTTFGLVEHIVVNVRGGKNVIVGGHKRVRVLKEAGETHADCIIVQLDAAKERHANFTLNNPAIRGEFVPHLVKQVLDELRRGAGESAEHIIKSLRFDVLFRSVMRNLPKTESSGVPRRVMEGRVDDDDTPALGRTTADSKLGVYYQLGDHRLYCGKIAQPGSLDGFGVVRADMAFSRFVQKERFAATYLDVHISHVLQNTDGAVYFATDFDTLGLIQSRFVALGGHWSTTLIAYPPKAKGYKDDVYRDVVVPVLYGWREGADHFFYGDRTNSNLLHLSTRPLKGDVPVEVAVKVLLNSSRAGDVVLDTHINQGASLIAAEKTGRKLIGVVRSAREMDRIRNRWTRFVHGEKADWRKKTGVAE